MYTLISRTCQLVFASTTRREMEFLSIIHKMNHLEDEEESAPRLHYFFLYKCYWGPMRNVQLYNIQFK